MNKYRQLGLIDYNGTLEVHPSLLNVVLHGRSVASPFRHPGESRGPGASFRAGDTQAARLRR